MYYFQNYTQYVVIMNHDATGHHRVNWDWLPVESWIKFEVPAEANNQY